MGHLSGFMGSGGAVNPRTFDSRGAAVRVINLENLQQFTAVNLLSDPGHIAGPKIIPNAAMVRLNWTLGDGKVAHNVMYAAFTGSPALSQTLAESVRAQLVSGGTWTALAAFLSTGLALASVTLLDVRSTTGTEINSTGAPTVGTSAQASLPDESAIVITLRTAIRGPSGRGRIYIPGFASNAVAAGNVVAAALVTALGNWANSNLLPAVALVGALQLGLPARQAYTSPLTGRVFPARTATTVPVTSVLVRDNHFDSQRRRGLK